MNITHHEENGMLIVHEQHHDTLKFFLSDSVPSSHKIWNIGAHMPDGYLPLIVTGGYDGCQVGVNNLIAVKTEGAQEILRATCHGCGRTVSDMEEYISKHGDAKANSYEHEVVAQMKTALPYMRKIKGL